MDRAGVRGRELTPLFCVGAINRFRPIASSRGAAPILCLLSGCDGAPSRSILGAYFPSWMICALVGIALAFAARAIFKASGLLEELPVPLVVMLAIACAGTFALWLIWLS
jgi:YtcA family